MLSLLWLSGCLGDRSLTFVLHLTLHFLSRLYLSNSLSTSKPVSRETVMLSPINNSEVTRLYLFVCTCVYVLM
jgi:hypothetical protein